MNRTLPDEERDRLVSVAKLVSGALMDASARLNAVRSHWDNNQVDGESAFLAATSEVANALEGVARDLRKGYKLDSKTMPFGR